MPRILSAAAVAAFLTGAALAADQTWTGKISDSMCGRSHKAAVEHGGKQMSDADCVKACIDKGAKYVLVVGGKVFNIENQDFAGLAEHAGHTVKVAGEKSGDSIKISNIETVGGEKKTG